MTKAPKTSCVVLIMLAASALLPAFAEGTQPTPLPVSIRVDASKTTGPLRPIWRFFGADEPNFAYMKDGRKLLGDLGQLGRAGKAQVYFRAHHLLTSGDGTYALKFGSTSAYKEDANGNAVYDWTINDRIFDTYLACGVKPYVEIGFMPEALSTRPDDYPRNPQVGKMAKVSGGQAYPPKDYARWGELCHQWVRHCVDRYGQAEVEQWYWEVWNEPNIEYWKGTPDEFFKLHDYAVDGVRRALRNARVGGPHNARGAGGSFLRDYLEHCARGRNYATGQVGTPLDFIAFHAKGRPEFVESHVRMGMANQLNDIDEAFAVVASFPEYRRTPIVIGECDPEGCAACRRPQDAYRNGTMYSSYTAASFPRIVELADQRGVNLEGALTWAFTFEDQPLFAGFRQLATGGVELPVLNTFRLLAKMSGQRVVVASSAGLDATTIRGSNVRGGPDVSALASLDRNRLSILVWHYHDDDVPGPAAWIEVTVIGLPGAARNARVTHYRIDAAHSNSFSLWQAIGSPERAREDQLAALVKAGQLATLAAAEYVRIDQGTATLRFDLPRQGVSLVVLDLDPASAGP